ncbi:hypothetical protein ACJX0J_016057, partial [Zea mays]
VLTRVVIDKASREMGLNGNTIYIIEDRVNLILGRTNRFVFQFECMYMLLQGNINKERKHFYTNHGNGVTANKKASKILAKKPAKNEHFIFIPTSEACSMYRMSTR